MTAQQLKASILQLAIQGKLVPQNPADEPASVLLKHIKAEKDALVKAGKIKKDKHESVIFQDENGCYFEKKGGKTIDITEEIPFDLPRGWAWSKMQTISSKITDGEHITPPRGKEYSGYYLISARNILNSEFNLLKVDYVSQETFSILSKRCSPQIGDILLSCSGSVGRCCICPVNNCVMVRSVALISPVFVSSSYLQYTIQSCIVQKQILEKKKKVAQANLFQAEIRSLYIPIPPLEEQARIVAKIEELLPHIEEYGKVETELSKLNAELPEQLKKSILQWAIQGRLVPQDPTDEPASELLKRIKAEKAALIKSGKLKKEKPLPPISEDDIPFDIPDSWQWVRLGTVLLPTGSKTPSGKFFDYIDIDAVDNSINRISSPKRIPVNNAPSRASREIAPGDVLFSLVRPYLKNIALVMDEHKDCIASTGFFVCRPSCGVDKEYLFYSMISSFIVNGINAHLKGDNSPSVRKEDIQNQLFPLPPLAEQQRIVNKLKVLFSTIHFC